MIKVIFLFILDIEKFKENFKIMDAFENSVSSMKMCESKHKEKEIICANYARKLDEYYLELEYLRKYRIDS